MLWLATLIFIPLTLLMLWAEDRLLRAREEILRQWSAQFALPLMRAFCLMAFIALAYPALFRLPDAPGFGALLAADSTRFDSLVNVLFFVGLLLPALPVLRRAPALVLPLQGAAGIALVGHWLALAVGAGELALMPNSSTLVMMATLSGFAAGLAALLSRGVNDTVAQQEVFDLLLLWLQIPVLVVYGQLLGARLAA